MHYSKLFSVYLFYHSPRQASEVHRFIFHFVSCFPVFLGFVYPTLRTFPSVLLLVGRRHEALRRSDLPNVEFVKEWREIEADASYWTLWLHTILHGFFRAVRVKPQYLVPSSVVCCFYWRPCSCDYERQNLARDACTGRDLLPDRTPRHR